jgi:dihydroxyacid dehydratase/phosphogluconate dehydratase
MGVLSVEDRLREAGVPAAEWRRPAVAVVHASVVEPGRLQAALLGVQSAGGNPFALASLKSLQGAGFGALVLLASSDRDLGALVKGALESGLPFVAVPKAGSPRGLAPLAEAAGFSLPGSSTAPDGEASRLQARLSGWQAVTLAHTRYAPRTHFQARARANARSVASSLDSARPARLALESWAGAAGLKALAPSQAYPAAPALLKPGARRWHADGGVPALMLLLWEKGLLDGSALGVTRGKLKRVLSEVEIPAGQTSFQLADSEDS